ncbi:MAG: hypothetical protein IKD06_04560 [Clostridia bacterium]|nr:hypothetical protein [Clostridia bacterium]
MKLIKPLCFYHCRIRIEPNNYLQAEYRCLRRLDADLGPVYDVEIVQYSPQEGFLHRRVAAFTSLRNRARSVTKKLWRLQVTCLHLQDVLEDLA